MKIKNFILYKKNKNLLNKYCNNCLLCLIICPKKKIKLYKKIKKYSCNLCNYCKINCNYKCIV